MDVFAMSLINSMLRDLDARRSDGHGVSCYESQVRAVPAKEAMHRRTWMVLAGGIVLLVAAVLLGSRVWHVFTLPWLAPGPKAATTVARVAAAASVPGTLPPHQLPLPPIGATSIPTALPLSMMPPPASQPETPVIIAIKPDVAAVNASKTALTAAEQPKETQQVKSATRAAKAASSSANEMLPTAQPVLKESGAQPVLVKKQIKEPTLLQSADNRYAAALELLEQGKQIAAIEELQQALHMNARHESARQALMSTLLNIGRKEEAMKLARDGLAEQPALPNIAIMLARLQVEQGELRPAINTLQRSLPYGADQTEYQALLAALLQRDEQHKQAVEHYLLALQRTPGAGTWWMGLAISYQALLMPTEAQQAFKRAKSTNTLNAELNAFVDARLLQLQRE
jgi:MSHA biogenesis protein MshN